MGETILQGPCTVLQYHGAHPAERFRPIRALECRIVLHLLSQGPTRQASCPFRHRAIPGGNGDATCLRAFHNVQGKAPCWQAGQRR